MAYGNWDDVVSSFEKCIYYTSRYIAEYPNRSADNAQWWIDNAIGMLDVIPVIRNDPEFARFIPFDSHYNLVLKDPTTEAQVNIYCNSLGSEYRVYQPSGDSVMCSRSAVVGILREWARTLQLRA